MSFRRGLYKEVEGVFSVVESLGPKILGPGYSDSDLTEYDRVVLSRERRRLEVLRKETLAALRRGRKAEMALAALSLSLAPVKGRRK